MLYPSRVRLSMLNMGMVSFLIPSNVMLGDGSTIYRAGHAPAALMFVALDSNAARIECVSAVKLGRRFCLRTRS